MEVRNEIYINGEWVTSSGSGKLEVFDSGNGEVMATIPEGTTQDVDRAVEAAAAAFPAWSALEPKERLDFITRIGEGLMARMDAIGKVISREVGMPQTLAGMVQVGLPAGAFTDLAAHVEAFPFEEELGNSLILREPIGVVGCITPWNYPLYQIALKVAPAMAVGCTVVLKPSEIAPLNAFALAEVCDEVGLPAGVFNLVTGVGPVVGEAIAAHPKVEAISFTGSTRAGKRVQQVGAENVKRVNLELGGKSANIILEDAPLDQAIPAGVFACMMNSGQTCSAHTRMLVPRSKLAEVEDLAVAGLGFFAFGDPFDEGVMIGPLVSQAQQDRVRGFINKGIDEGAKLLVGGAEQPAEHPNGYYVSPTIFSEVTRDMTIAREEIFGPVLSIMPYDSVDEAVEIANDSEYGLSGGVWGGNPDEAMDVARRLRTGQVDVNGGQFNPSAPFGGYKQSGNGRERGRWGLEEFLETKAIQR